MNNGLKSGFGSAATAVSFAGAYEPTFTPTLNVSSAVLDTSVGKNLFRYTKTGSIVRVDGQVVVTTSASGVAAFRISLPPFELKSPFSANISGHGISSNTNGGYLIVSSTATIPVALVNISTTAAAVYVYRLSFCYQSVA